VNNKTACETDNGITVRDNAMAFVLISGTHDNDIAIGDNLMAYNQDNNVAIREVIVFVIRR
jgi:hypothetical protein